MILIAYSTQKRRLAKALSRVFYFTDSPEFMMDCLNHEDINSLPVQSSLSPKQLLHKDQKLVECDSQSA